MEMEYQQYLQIYMLIDFTLLWNKKCFLLNSKVLNSDIYISFAVIISFKQIILDPKNYLYFFYYLSVCLIISNETSATNIIWNFDLNRFLLGLVKEKKIENIQYFPNSNDQYNIYLINYHFFLFLVLGVSLVFFWFLPFPDLLPLADLGDWANTYPIKKNTIANTIDINSLFFSNEGSYDVLGVLLALLSLIRYLKLNNYYLY